MWLSAFNIKSGAVQTAREHTTKHDLILPVAFFECLPLSILSCLHDGAAASLDDHNVDPWFSLPKGLFYFDPKLNALLKGGIGCRSPPPCFGLPIKPKRERDENEKN